MSATQRMQLDERYLHVALDTRGTLAARLAAELADRAWAERKVPLPPMRTVREAIDEVARKPRRFTLVDVERDQRRDPASADDGVHAPPRIRSTSCPDRRRCPRRRC